MTTKQGQGRIVTSFGRRFIVQTETGEHIEATTRSKRVDFVCGDFVNYTRLNHEQLVIENTLPRQNLLYRQDHFRSKMFAANITQLAVVTAAVPSPSEELLQRALIAAEAAKIQSVIIVNKTDLPETPQWADKLAFYQNIGYPLIFTSAYNNDTATLKIALAGHCTIFLGQSGMGKSSLTNILLGKNTARTAKLSTALDSGRHTTTHTQLYQLDENSQLIDSPGLQEFGLKQIKAEELVFCFPDMRAFIGKCRFHNCTHREEPDCALKNAADAKQIFPARLKLLQKIMCELTRK